MTLLKDKIINHIIDIEGGYSDNKNDRGGKTKYGITEYVARANGYTGDMENLPRELAFNIYSYKYWDSIKLDDIMVKSKLIAFELADTGINCGTTFARKSLQRVLNVMNNKGQYWPDLTVDGLIGYKTIKAFNEYWLLRDDMDGEETLWSALNSLQVARYITLAERKEKQEEFVFGWIRNRGRKQNFIDIMV